MARAGTTLANCRRPKRASTTGAAIAAGSVQQAHGHAESRDGVVVFRTFEGEITSARLTDLAGLDDGDRRADHLTAIGDKADVTIVADEREEEEHREDGSGQDPVAPDATM